MIAEILATGDEVRLGSLVDTNSAYIAQELAAVDLDVVRHSCVGDDLTDLETILREISNRADVAVITGGLGPTDDDLTADAVARAAGVDLVLDPQAMKSVQRFFKTRRRPLNESSKKQAYLPEGAHCLSNPVGTAPGFCLKIERCLFFCLPGVPSEMRQMLADKVIPRIIDLQGTAKTFRRVQTLSIFGLTESVTGESLAGFNERYPQIKLGFRATFPIIQVKLYGGGSDENALTDLMGAASRWVCSKLGNRVFSETGETLETVVGNLLREKSATLAVAESCTGGLISHRLTDVAGSSDYFIFSAVTYANRSKMKILAVTPETIEKYGAVSKETAGQMARGVRDLAGATYGLSTSGIAGPSGGTETKPVGTVCIGLATPQSVSAQRFYYSYDNRRLNKQIFAATALDLLRRELLGIEPPSSGF